MTCGDRWRKINWRNHSLTLGRLRPCEVPVVDRSKFSTLEDVSIFDVQLDPLNPRIRHGADQNECIERIASDRDTFLRLMRDIASSGLSPEHILLSKSSDGKLRVRDGNRRVTALKLLKRPDMCLPDEALRNIVSRISSAAIVPPLEIIDCLYCEDEPTILDYLRRRHTGENAGIGQVGWSALLIALFNANVGVVDQNRRAAQLVLWMEERGKHVANDFPVTTLTRLLNSDTLAILGFCIQDDKLTVELSELTAYALASRVLDDIASNIVNVARGDGAPGTISVYALDAAIAYVRRIREEIAPSEATGKNEPSPPAAAGGPTSGGPGGSGTSGPANAPGNGPQSDGGGSTNPIGGGGSDAPPQPAPGQPAAPAPARPGTGTSVKPSWDRPSLFGRRKNSSPGFAVPTERLKVITILGELRKLNPNESPLAVTMLFRALLELSDKAYRENHGIPDKGGLHKDIAASADHMKDRGRLTAAQHSVIVSYTRHEPGMLHVKSIQKYIHEDTYHPHGQGLNTMWDEIGCFVAACWS